MTSTIKVNNIQNQCGQNIINENSNTITIGASGDTIALASGASQSGFGRAGSVDWDTTAKTASFTAVSGNGYFVNTTSGAITVTLPASPSAGDIVAVVDYAGTADTNNITIGRNSSNINGAASDLTMSKENSGITLVYVDGTQGWKGTESFNLDDIETQPAFVTATGGTITTCGNFKIHTFTGPGTFCVSCAGNPQGSTSVDYLVVAGGASGGTGSGNGGGGGGAGGYRESGGNASGCYSIGLPANSCVSAISVTATAFPITVGAGGAAITGSGNGSATPGNPGVNSIFSTITSAGGGAGSPQNAAGTAGGSGGGAGGGSQGPYTAAAGNTPPVSPPQGNPGGAISPPRSPDIASSGGGGAGGAAPGIPNTPVHPQSFGGNGGIGATSSITGSAKGYAGGGGGNAYQSTRGNDHNWPNGLAATPGVAVCAAAAFGGGKGGNWNNPGSMTGGESGATNKGGGGGGSGGCGSGGGGSGIVIIRYKFQ